MRVILHWIHTKVSYLAVVDTNNRANHLGNDDHVTEVGLNNSRLLVRESLLLCLAELFDETHRLALKPPLETSAGAGVDKLSELDKIAGELRFQSTNIIDDARLRCSCQGASRAQ